MKVRMPSARFAANGGEIPVENGTSKGHSCWLNCVSGVMPLFIDVLEIWLFVLAVCLNWMRCRCPSNCTVIASAYES
jgi:hypothetical protein